MFKIIKNYSNKSNGIILFSFISIYFIYYIKKIYIKYKNKEKIDFRNGLPGLIGNTPLFKLTKLSEETGCCILAKAEFMNPGGSSKDRIAKGIIENALKTKELFPGGTIVEGTSGSTGISLSLIAKAYGLNSLIIMPDDVAKEKIDLLTMYGAKVELVKPSAIINSDHYVNQARKKAKNLPGSYFIDQFENLENYRTHYTTTGPEIWQQTKGNIDAFVMSSGTGGTIAGVSTYLKDKSSKSTHKNDHKSIKVYLVDPPGSSLYHKIRSNVCYTKEQSERHIKRHRYDTVTEGIGLDRLTGNFLKATIDDSFFISDEESVWMSRYLLQNEGIFIGSSSAVNVVGAVRAAQKLKKDNNNKNYVIVTILCDAGYRHLSKFWNDEYLKDKRGITMDNYSYNNLSFLDTFNPQP